MRQYETLAVPARVGLLADTHRSSRNPRALPAQLTEALKDCDYIFHAGDLCAPWVLKTLTEIAPTFAVRGNNEEPPLDDELPVEIEFQAGRHRIGMIHGHIGGRTAKEAVSQRFGNAVDVVVYGHSHQPEIITRDGVLMVNPGSPTQRRFAPHHTYAIMQIDEEIGAELFTIESRV